jgi:ubiquinone/menaquinone biosynthesis C-methylase UbiE
MLERVLEPEIMDTERDALEYEAIDNTAVNQEFADQALSLLPLRGRVLDIGTGPGDIAVLMAKQAPGLYITAIDLAEHMLALARRNVERAGVGERVRIERLDAKATGYADASFDAIISNSLVHHIPEPLGFFKEVARLGGEHAGLFIKDLLRPPSRAELDAIVDQYAGGQSDYQRKLFSDSLNAALRLEEVEALCEEAGLSGLEIRQCSDRHWTALRSAHLVKGSS